MQRSDKILRAIFLIFLSIFLTYTTVYSQPCDCRFFRDSNYDYGEQTWDLDIGDQVEVQLESGIFVDNDKPSWLIFNDNAAIRIEVIEDLPENYPFFIIHSEQDCPRVGGGDMDNLLDRKILVQCVDKNEYKYIQPDMLLPLDRSSLFDPGDVSVNNFPPGSKVLVLRRAFFCANSEDSDCNHGPWASIGLSVHSSDLLYDYQFSFEEIARDYCGGNDVDFFEEPLNDCNEEVCESFLENYPTLSGGGKIPGPIYSEGNDCAFGLAPNPKNEWIDGPWGTCYTSIPIYRWNSSSPDEICLVMREGDDTNCDDFLGAGLVSRDETGPILINAWVGGWIIVENIEVPESGMLENIDIADYYWYNKWNGVYPDNEGVYTTHDYDQYWPLHGVGMLAMQAVMPENSTVGLLGGEFLVSGEGVLSKPMTYIAPCEPAVFEKLKSSVWCGDEDGGEVFDLPIPYDAELLSIRIWSGNRIDGIRLKIRLSDGNVIEKHIGGYGGDMGDEIEIGENKEIIGANTRCGDRVDSIQFLFSDGTSSPVYGGGGGEPQNIMIPSDNSFRGFFGRSGNEVDQIGFLFSSNSSE